MGPAMTAGTIIGATLSTLCLLMVWKRAHRAGYELALDDMLIAAEGMGLEHVKAFARVAERAIEQGMQGHKATCHSLNQPELGRNDSNPHGVDLMLSRRDRRAVTEDHHA